MKIVAKYRETGIDQLQPAVIEQGVIKIMTVTSGGAIRGATTIGKAEEAGTLAHTLPLRREPGVAMLDVGTIAKAQMYNDLRLTPGSVRSNMMSAMPSASKGTRRQAPIPDQKLINLLQAAIVRKVMMIMNGYVFDRWDRRGLYPVISERNGSLLLDLPTPLESLPRVVREHRIPD